MNSTLTQHLAVAQRAEEDVDDLNSKIVEFLAQKAPIVRIEYELVRDQYIFKAKIDDVGVPSSITCLAGAIVRQLRNILDATAILFSDRERPSPFTRLVAEATKARRKGGEVEGLTGAETKFVNLLDAHHGGNFDAFRLVYRAVRYEPDNAIHVAPMMNAALRSRLVRAGQRRVTIMDNWRPTEAQRVLFALRGDPKEYEDFETLPKNVIFGGLHMRSPKPVSDTLLDVAESITMLIEALRS